MSTTAKKRLSKMPKGYTNRTDERERERERERESKLGGSNIKEANVTLAVEG